MTLPRRSVWQAHRTQQFMEQLLFAFPSLMFRIVATQERIE